MAEKLKDIVESNPDLHLINVNKHNSLDRNLWEFQVLDSSIDSKKLNDYRYQTVMLRRDNHFFLAYKFMLNDRYEYFVDPRRAIYRTGIHKYVNSLVSYSVYSNDVSKTKNEPSFRVTLNAMRGMNIDNFLDLCYHYRDYSAIGTGTTRNIRNLVVMDIDVDCTKPDNRQELDRVLMMFASCSALPDFCVFNTESKHVQLQWLIQNYKYKEINQEMVDNVVQELAMDSNKNKEVKYFGIDFTKIDNPGVHYRKYTLAMCSLSKKRKFGDRNYTFWKAKNPMAALMKNYGLELWMPYFEDGEIKYRSQEEMEEMFATKESREEYFSKAPDMKGLYDLTREMMSPYVEKLKDTQVMKIEDGDDVSLITKDKPHKAFGTSRNNFVLNCSRTTTWEICAEYGYRTASDIRNLTKETIELIRKQALKTVRQRFKAEDKKYDGHWPDTTNLSEYTQAEFKVTFNRSFNYAIQNLNIETYTDIQRTRSQESRHLKMDMRMMVVDRIRKDNREMTRIELLKEVNSVLKDSGKTEISFGSLKRYISRLNGMDEESKTSVAKELKEGQTERRRQFDRAVEEHKNQRTIDVCKKRLEYIDIS